MPLQSLESMTYRRWVALNPEVLTCANCRGSGGVGPEMCPICNGQGTLPLYDDRVRKQYDRQVSTDRLKKQWWKECFPYLFKEEDASDR